MTLKKVWVLLYTFVRVLLNTSILTVYVLNFTQLSTLEQYSFIFMDN